MSGAAQNNGLPEDKVRRWLRDYYSLEGDLDRLPGDCDLNYKLSTKEGETYVCKLTHGSCDRELLSAQNEAMELLNQSDLAAIPHVLASKQGESLVPLNDGAGQAYVGRVLTFVPGIVLAKCAPYSAELLRNLGRTVGRLNQALAGYDHSAFHFKFNWDLAHAMEPVDRYRDLIADPQLRDEIDQVYQNFNDIVVPRFGTLKKSVIHNDANDYNILAEGDEVTGLIDFGDMVHTYTICDLAIAMGYTSLGSDDVLQVIQQMAIGYNEFMPLVEDELTVLFPMMCMRLAVSSCMGVYQIRQRPDDPYLAISQEPIRRTLPKLLALDANEVHDLLKEILV